MKDWESSSQVWDYKTLSSPEFRPLNTEEERELMLMAKNGDKSAKDRIIKSNVRFIVAKAKILARDSGVPVEDLISEGILALYEAFENFNPKKNVRFLSYAKPYVDKAMYSYIKSYKILSHMPTISRKDMVKIIMLYQKLGREPSEEEVAKELGYDRKKVKNIMEAIDWKVLRVESLDNEDPEKSIYDTFSYTASTPEDIVEEEYNQLKIEELINEIFESGILNEKEKTVLWKHVFEDKNLAQIARELGYSREYIRQIKESAKKKILQKFPQMKNFLEPY